jgi:hypothetical protein
MNTDSTIEELLDALLSKQYVSDHGKQGINSSLNFLLNNLIWIVHNNIYRN